MSTASLGLPSLLCVVLAASSPPLEHQCWKAFVSKAGRMPHVLQLKTGLKGGEWSSGKDKCTDGPTVGLFLGSLHILNTDGGCCFSPSPEHFTPVLVIKLSLPSRLPFFPCFSLCFSCGNIYITPGNCHQGADFPCQPLQLLFPSGSIRGSRICALIEHTGETMGTSGEASMWVKANRPWQAQSLGSNLLWGILPTPCHLWVVHVLCLP